MTQRLAVSHAIAFNTKNRARGRTRRDRNHWLRACGKDPAKIVPHSHTQRFILQSRGLLCLFPELRGRAAPCWHAVRRAVLKGGHHSLFGSHSLEFPI